MSARQGEPAPGPSTEEAAPTRCAPRSCQGGGELLRQLLHGDGQSRGGGLQHPGVEGPAPL